MARPLRLEFEGAIYHVFVRGDDRTEIYLDDGDRRAFLALLSTVCDRFNWVVHAYCLMGNHYHLLIETPDANLSRGMRQLNGVYTQRFNRRHERVGHVFQGRFRSILVQRGTYLLELSRYIVLNPVRARLVAAPGEWLWSSYRAQIGAVPSPLWLDTVWLLGQFGDRMDKAIKAYIGFVAAGKDARDPLEMVRDQLYLGDESFLKQLRVVARERGMREIPKMQRRSLAGTLAEYESHWPDRREAMARAYRSGAYTMRSIAEHFGVHYMTVSRAVRAFERMLQCET